MEFIYKLAEYIANYLDAAYGILFVTFTLGRNTRIANNKIFVAITIVFIAVLGYLQDCTTDSVIQDFIIYTICFLFSLLFLNKSIGRKLIVTMVFLLILTFTNMLVTYSIVSIAHITIEQFCTPSMLRLFALLFHKIIFFAILLIASTFLQRQVVSFRLCLITTLLLTGILLSCSIIINISKEGNLTETQESQLLIVTVGICAISIAVGICIYQMSRQYHQKLENTKLISRLQEEESILNKINDLYENNRILQHDLTRHFSILQGLLAHNDIGQAQSYIAEITQKQLSRTAYVYTNSNILNNVLNEKAEQCLNADIAYQVTMSGMIEESLQMNLGIILSNLIDNAIEAECLQKKEQRKINIRLSHDKGMYYLTVENYIAASVLDTNPSLHTSKTDKEHHGLGVKSVRRIVRSLDGICQQTEQNSYFIITIILPDSTKYA